MMMIFAAKVKSKDVLGNTFTVTPLYIRIDGQDALDISALPMNGLVPAVGDVVFCAECINDFAQSMQLIINKNGGAYPIIFASIATSLVYDADVQIKGDVILGLGGKKMVLGDALATWAQGVDAALQSLYKWAATGAPPVPAVVGQPTGGIAPFSDTPALQAWQATNLSQNHQLD